MTDTEVSQSGAVLIDESNQKLIGTEIPYDAQSASEQDNESNCSSKRIREGWTPLLDRNIIKKPYDWNMTPPHSIVAFSADEDVTPEILMKNGDCAVFYPAGDTGWHCQTDRTITFLFEKYPTDMDISQTMVIGYIYDGVMYNGTSFSEQSGAYSLHIKKGGTYQFYVISATPDYLALKEGRVVMK